MNSKYSKLIKGAFGLLSAVLISLPLFYHVYASSTETDAEVQSAFDAQKTAYATLTIYDGTVSIKPPGESTFQKTTKAMRITEGTYVSTGPSGRAQISYPSGTTTRIDSNSTIQLTEFDPKPQKILVSVLKGRVWSRVKKLLGTESYETESNGVTATVRGTAYEHSAAGGVTLTRVVEGTIVVTCPDSDRATAIAASLKGQTDCSKPVETEVQPLTEEDAKDEWITFNTNMDKLPVIIPSVTTSPAAQSSTPQGVVNNSGLSEKSDSTNTGTSPNSGSSSSNTNQSGSSYVAPTAPPTANTSTPNQPGAGVTVDVGVGQNNNDSEVSVGVGGTDVNVNLPGNLPVDINIGLGKDKDKKENNGNGNANGREGGNGECNGAGNPNCNGKD